MPFLKNDITSAFKRGHIYGKAGDPVTVISRHAGVILVVSSKGDRFHVAVQEITEDETIIAEALSPEPPPPRKQKKGKVAPAAGNTLF